MRLRLLLAVAALLVVAALAVGYFFIANKEKETVLRASGTIEATDIDVSFQMAGRVAEVLAVEGQAVRNGDVLARMDAEELTQHMNQIQASLDAVLNQTRQQEAVVAFRRSAVEEQITQAQSEADALRAASERVRQGSRPQEIRVAEADLAQAEAQLVQRRADFERATLLQREGIIPRQQFDAAEAAVRTAEANRDAASQRLVLAQEGSRSQDIAEAEARAAAGQSAVKVAEAGRSEVDAQRAALDVARARERELRAQLEAVRTQLGYTEIRSPLTGMILTKNVESGEVVSPGTPVVTVADTEELWMNVYIPETQTGLVKLGQTVRVRVDSFPTETFEGKVTFISPESEFTPKTIMTPEERVKLVYRVKLSLENKQQRLKPGMPADAEIMLGTIPARSAEVVPPSKDAPRAAPPQVASPPAVVRPAPVAPAPAVPAPAVPAPAVPAPAVPAPAAPAPAAPAPAAPAPAAPAPAAPAPAAPAPAAPAPAAPAPAAPAPAAPAPPVPAPPRRPQPQTTTGLYTVQVGAFGVRANAEALVAALGKKYEAVTLVEIGTDATPYHVRVGGFSDLQSARELVAQLKSDGFNAFVVK